MHLTTRMIWRGAGSARRAPAALLLATALLAGCSPSRTLESMSLLSSLRSGEAAREVERRGTRYTVAGIDYQGDLYRSTAAQPKADLVLVPGVTPQGRDDPRLVTFARLLARARFTVLVPELPNLRRLEVDPADAQAIAHAVRHLAGSSEHPREVGLVAISYAAGPAILAALRPELSGRLAFVLAIGGYYDSAAVVTFFTTGAFRAPGDRTWRFLQPNARGKWVFVRSNVGRLESPDDRRLLAEMARRKLTDLEAPIEDLAYGLGPEGRSVLALLQNDDPERAPDLLARLPPGVRLVLTDLDLSSRDLDPLPAPLLLLHGRDDRIIPYSESLALADALPPGRAQLFLIDAFEHVDLGDTSLGDGFQLFRLTYRVLQERDRVSRARDPT